MYLLYLKNTNDIQTLRILLSVTISNFFSLELLNMIFQLKKNNWPNTIVLNMFSDYITISGAVLIKQRTKKKKTYNRIVKAIVNL